MQAYPQLPTGALSQFPLSRRRRARTVVNTMAGGRTVKLPDVAGQTTEWQLQYAGLSDAELATLQQFFAAMEGSLNGFTFLDPNANLLSWSDDPSQEEWQKASFLTLTGGIADPRQGQAAWTIANSGAGAQSLSQTLNTPASYVYCLSAYARSTQPTTVTLLLGSLRAVRLLGADWTRLTVTGTGDAGASSISFGIELPAGAAIDLYGPQVEPQASPSAYKGSTTGGVYENSHFRDDIFSYTSTGLNQHSTTVNILYANHL
jgi:hypothetical protein